METDMSHDFEKLLSPVNIGGIKLKNRIYKPPSGTKLFNNTNGYVSEEGKLIYEAWARGGPGCIVVESPAIGDELSIDIPNKFLINDDKFIPGLTELVNMLGADDIDNVPTCGTVEMRFNINGWKEVGRVKAAKMFFDYPKKHRGDQ